MTPTPSRLITLKLDRGQIAEGVGYMQLTEPELLELIRLCAEALRSIYAEEPDAYHDLVE